MNNLDREYFQKMKMKSNFPEIQIKTVILIVQGRLLLKKMFQFSPPSFFPKMIQRLSA